MAKHNNIGMSETDKSRSDAPCLGTDGIVIRQVEAGGGLVSEASPSVARMTFKR